MNREPIFWTTTQDGYNTADRERVRMGADGVQRLERFPQVGHVGDYEHKTLADGQRFVYVCRADGNVVALVLTCAAAHMDSSSSFGTWQRRKCAAMGWFPAAGCVAKLVVSGELARGHLAAKLAHDAEPCDPRTHSLDEPCRHTQAELDARRARNKAQNDARMAKFKGEADKLLEETRKTNDHLADAHLQQAEANTRIAQALELLAGRGVLTPPAPTASSAEPPIGEDDSPTPTRRRGRRGDDGGAE